MNPLLLPVYSEFPEGNWPEDFSHENGNYQCLCCSCNKVFVGHKRRVVCKQCSTEAVIEEVFIAMCERESPNSPEFDRLLEAAEERALLKAGL
jgi:hypothetical protein